MEDFFEGRKHQPLAFMESYLFLRIADPKGQRDDHGNKDADGNGYFSIGYRSLHDKQLC